MRKFWLLIISACLSVILVFSVAGCRGEVSSVGAAKEEVPEKEELNPEQTLESLEQPDKELFDKYFCCIDLNLHSSFKDANTLLPHQEASFGVIFKNKKNFIFRIAVFNLETNDFIERCAMTTSSQGSDGFSMEALEWAFLSPGSYEYRIYVENTLAAALPFEVMSYVDYFFRNSGEEEAVLSNGVEEEAGGSPDGPKIVFISNRDGNREIYVMDSDGSNQIRLTDNNSEDAAPYWSPDGSKIAFMSADRDGNSEIYVMDTDGKNKARLTNNDSHGQFFSWSPDGSKIVFESDCEIYVMDSDGSNQVRLTNNYSWDGSPCWSTR